MEQDLASIPIVMQGLPKWDAPYEATSFHIAKGLSEKRKVYYVEHPFTWKDYINNFNSPHIKRRTTNTTDQPFRSYENLTYIYAPFVPPFNFLPEGFLFNIVCRYANKRIWKRVRKIFRKQKTDRFIYINSFDPVFNFAKFHYNQILQIYICYDWMDSNPYIARHGVREERKIMKMSDFVVCTSKNLRSYAESYNENSHFIGNAVNIDHFLDSVEGPPEKYEQIEKPIILYLGNIDNRLNYDLISITAKKNPDFQFVFVGPIQASANELVSSQRKNIHLLGPVSYNEVPRYMKNADICWIPFRKTEQTKYIYPLKLHEYLACGKPVITTNFTELEEFRDVVHITDQNTAIEKSVFDKLINNATKKKQSRINVAKKNTWANRIEEWNSLINHFLGKKAE